MGCYVLPSAALPFIEFGNKKLVEWISAYEDGAFSIYTTQCQVNFCSFTGKTAFLLQSLVAHVLEMTYCLASGYDELSPEQQPGVCLTSKLGMKISSTHLVQKHNFTFHDWHMHTNCSLVCVHAQLQCIFQVGTLLCIFSAEVDLRQKGKGKGESQFPSMKYINWLPDRESPRLLTCLADPLGPGVQNSVLFVLEKALINVPNCH